MTNAARRNHGIKQSKPSNRGKRLASLGMMLMLGLLANSPAEAQALDGTAIQKLALRSTWQSEGIEFGNWTRKEDKTVCFRLADQKGDCADTGTWTIDGDVMCYQLSWYGTSTAINKNCFTVQALGNDRCETLYHGGALVSKFFSFKIRNCPGRSGPIKRRSETLRSGFHGEVLSMSAGDRCSSPVFWRYEIYSRGWSRSRSPLVRIGSRRRFSA